MKQYQTVTKLVEAYKEYYNSNRKPWEQFGSQEIYDICISIMVQPFAKAKHGIDSSIYLVEGFGYALTNDRQKAKVI